MQPSTSRVFIVGVGMTKFLKPGKHSFEYTDLANQAVSRALRDANVQYQDIEQAFAGYVYGDSTCGQRALYTVGMTGIPIINVNNNCSTGSTALYLAHNSIKGGANHCVLALGFEKMFTGSLKTFFSDRTSPMTRHFVTEMEIGRGADVQAPFAPKMFGNAGLEHMEKYGTKPEHFAKIAEKNHRHSVNNPYSQFRDLYSLEQIQKAPTIYGPLTKLQCCPTSDGAAAAVVVSEQFVKEHGLEDQAVEILGTALTTDKAVAFDSKSNIEVVGFDCSKNCAEKVYKMTGVKPSDIQVVELHDCFSANELITYEALGLCPVGKAGEFIDKGDNTYGGKVVVNPSGGLISKGHPLGATGLAQAAEMCWQLRGMAGKRQVKDCKLALSHNLGLGGAAVVTIYKKYQEGYQKNFRKDQSADPDVLEKIESQEEERAKL